jgi:putative hemolysin
MKDRMEASLAVVQLGITFVGAVAAAIGGAGMSETLEPYLAEKYGFSEAVAEILALVCLVIPLSCITIIFAELVPKMFAFHNREWVCLKLSPLMRNLSYIAYPLVRIFEAIVKMVVGFGSRRIQGGMDGVEQIGIHELKAAATLARSSRLIGANQEKIVLSAADLSLRPISSIMLLASEISMIPLRASMNDALVKAHLDMRTRFPVCAEENDPQTIQGYVSFKDIINALKTNPENPTLESVTRPIKSLKTDTPISDALAQMIHDKIHIALVRSGDGRVAGMVTLEDIMEELVGEIEDEFDRLPMYIHAFGASWIMGGGVSMGAVLSKIGRPVSPEEERFKNFSLAEWVSHKLGRPLRAGEMVHLGGLTVTTRKLRRKKLYEAVVSTAGTN